MTRCVFAMVVVAVFATPALSAQTPTATPMPLPGATGCQTPDPTLTSDVEASFSSYLESPTLQRFIALLGSATQRAQNEIVSRASAAVRSPDHTAARAALANVCPSKLDAIAFSRAVVVISHVWNVAALNDSQHAADVTELIYTAVSALAHPDVLSIEQSRAAALPFATLATSAPTLMPTLGATEACPVAYADAAPVHLVQPAYPPVAQALRATGTVEVKVALSATGGVRSVSVYANGAGDGAGAQSLVEAAIVAAGATTYTPGRLKCVPFSGSYLFRATFKAK